MSLFGDSTKEAIEQRVATALKNVTQSGANAQVELPASASEHIHANTPIDSRPG